jgi:hypothetical protein
MAKTFFFARFPAIFFESRGIDEPTTTTQSAAAGPHQHKRTTPDPA